MSRMALDNRAGVQKISIDPSLNKKFYETEEEINRKDYLGDTSQILVAWGLPRVSVDKYFSFKAKVIQKHLDNIGVSWESVRDFYMPVEGHEGHISEPDDLPAKGKTIGMFFIEFCDEDTASDVFRKLNGEDITKKHKWHIVRFADWQTAETNPTEFVPPSLDDFKSSNSARAWLEDPQGRDQFMVRYREGDEHKCAVYWCDHRRGGAVKDTDFSGTMKRSVLTTYEAEWSPLGSYILTRHSQGMRSLVQNRTGEWIEDQKFEHAVVDFWDFSPQEKYLVTYSSEEDEDNSNVIFWNIETGEEIRPFDATQSRKFGIQWPFFKWSFDDKYFAWMQSTKVKKRVIPEDLSLADADKIVIYSTETFRRVGGSSCECKNVKVMDFCPTKHLLVHVTAGTEDKPTNINILTVPEKELKVSYPQVSVHRVNLFWHTSGDYLCAAIIKRKKRKKKKSGQRSAEPDAFSLCIFFTAHKNFPRQTIDLGKESVRHVTWEPTDPKICVLQEHAGNLFQITVYEFGYDKTNPIRHRLFNDPDIKIPKFSNVAYISWSPMGRYMCLHHNNGNRTFFDSQKLKRVRGKDKVKEHDSAENLTWSPCGRFVVSTVFSPLSQDNDGAGATDNAWVMYNFQGDDIAKQTYKGTKGSSKCLYSFDWRPRPPSLLNNKQKADIQRRLRDDYWDEFEEVDKQIRAEGISEEIRRMLELESEWKEISENLKTKAKTIKQRREELRDGRLSEDEEDFDFEEVEEEMRIEDHCTQTLLTAEQLEDLVSN